MKHNSIGRSKIVDCSFAPFEDFLGIGTDKGFESVCIPGAGEAKFDAWEANLFETEK